MLKDCGLATEEEIKAEEAFLNKRMSGNGGGGCINTRICKSCKHIISDSICLCVGIFTCPNCNHRNGAELEEWRKNTPINTTNTFNLSNFIPTGVAKSLAEYERHLSNGKQTLFQNMEYEEKIEWIVDNAIIYENYYKQNALRKK